MSASRSGTACLRSTKDVLAACEPLRFFISFMSFSPVVKGRHSRPTSFHLIIVILDCGATGARAYIRLLVFCLLFASLMSSSYGSGGQSPFYLTL